MKNLLFILLLTPLMSLSQILTDESKVSIIPPGNEGLVLYAAADCDHCYYYLPSSLRVASRGAKGTPEVSLVTWKDDENAKTTGGILHLLVEWGLKSDHEKNVQKALRSTHDSLAVLMGPVLVTAYDSGGVIDGNDKLSSLLNACLNNTPTIPTTPGAKMALSFRFTEKEIDDFLYYMKHPEKSKADIRMAYTYSVQTASGMQRINRTTLRLPFREILTTIK